MLNPDDCSGLDDDGPVDLDDSDIGDDDGRTDDVSWFDDDYDSECDCAECRDHAGDWPDRREW